MRPIQHRLYTILTAICLLWPLYGICHHEAGVHFNRLSLEDGLSQSTVQAIFQDSKGFVWMATQDGLNRYDGHHFEIFKHERNNPQTLSYNLVSQIMEYPAGTLWVATWAGLNKLDLSTGKFKRYQKEDPKLGLKDDYIICVWQEKHKPHLMWVGTQAGLYLFDANSETFTNISMNGGDVQEPKIKSLWRGADSVLWVGTENKGLFAVHSGSKRIIQQYGTKNGLPSQLVEAIYQESSGRLWVGTDKGLALFFPEEGYAEAIPAGALPSQHITAIRRDRDGNVWVGTRNGLAKKAPGKQMEFDAYKNDPFDRFSLPGNRISSIYEDHHGIIWIGTYFNGIAKLDKLASKFEHYQETSPQGRAIGSNVVRAIASDKKGRIWVGTSRGISIIDRKQGASTHIGQFPNQPQDIAENNIRAVFIDRDEGVWVGTGGFGLYYLPPNGTKWEALMDKPNYPALCGDVRKIVQDGKGDIWFGTQGGGLVRTNPAGWEFTQFMHIPNDNRTIVDNSVHDIFIDRKGAMWIGTLGGLSKYDPTYKSFFSYTKNEGNPSSLPNNYVKCILEDSKGRLWIGTAGTGLCLLENREMGRFVQFTEEHGLPNSMIYGILEDDSLNLWLSTNKGIAKFSMEQRTFKSYDISDGLQDREFNTGAFHKTAQGEFFFGGVKGLNAFFPKRMLDNPYPATPVVTALRIFNKPVYPDSSGRIAVCIPFASDVYLHYTDRMVSFELAALHYAFPERTQFMYRLLDFDDEWRLTDAHNRIITYTNLDPGSYVLEIKASNNDHLWNETPLRLNIHVSPPFWASWWFRMLAASSIVGGLVVAYWLKITNMRAHRIMLERTVHARTRELAKEKRQIEIKNEEIKLQNEELRQQQDEILAQRDFIEEKHRLLAQTNKRLEAANKEVSLQKDMLDASLRQMELLSRIGKNIAMQLDIEDIATIVYEQANMLMDASSFGIGIYDDRAEVIEFHGFIERGIEMPFFTNPLKPNKYLSAHCLAFRKEIVIGNVAEQIGAFLSEPMEVHEGETPSSIVYLPLMVEGRTLGVLTVQSLFANAYTEHEINALRSLSVYVAIALDNARAYGIIKRNNRDITDSIEYARNIQRAILPTQQLFKEAGLKHFIIYRPKDIVSGDFYWLSKHDNPKYGISIAVVDCTGHGVPGAFMSMIGHSLLNEIVHSLGVRSPGRVLELLDQHIRHDLRQELTKNTDGMDVAFCTLLPAEKDGFVRVQFAGAKRDIWYIQGNDVKMMKASRRSVGGRHFNLASLPFEEQEFVLPKGTCLYLFTDGIIDQHARNSNRFGSKRLRQILLEVHKLPMSQQESLLSSFFMQYQGQAEQRDDMTMLGIKL